MGRRRRRWGWRGEMVLVNISSLAGPFSLKMHILIVFNESRLKIDDFRVFKKISGFFGPDKPF